MGGHDLHVVHTAAFALDTTSMRRQLKAFFPLLLYGQSAARARVCLQLCYVDMPLTFRVVSNLYGTKTLTAV